MSQFGLGIGAAYLKILGTFTELFELFIGTLFAYGIYDHGKVNGERIPTWNGAP